MDSVQRRKEQNLRAVRGDARSVTPSIRSFAQAIDRARQAVERVPVLRAGRPGLRETAAALDDAEVAALAFELDDPSAELHLFAAAAHGVSVPVLRTDLILEEFQLYESRAAGADAVLLRPDLLGDGLARLAQAAAGTHMAPVIVCRTRADVERALAFRGAVLALEDLSLAPARRAHVIALGPAQRGQADAVLDWALGDAPDPAAAFRAALKLEEEP